ncbi:unnamed protein product [Amoebophrya sp. A120]|nr:unnamed protein product [Amoebophrya sp. A120]|eukprot:GSA120T00008048001.1
MRAASQQLSRAGRGLFRPHQATSATGARQLYSVFTFVVVPRNFSSAAAPAAAKQTETKFLKPEKEIDLNDARRKGLSWRAKQRGWLELDWLLGTFAQKHLANLTEEECVLFEEILEVDNPDLFHWLSAQKPAPEKMLENSVYLMLAEYVNSEHPDIMRRMSTQNQNL